MSNKRSHRTEEARNGQAAIEFGVAVPFLLLFAITGFAVGMMFDRYLTVIQFNRNAGNMFARGVDFNLDSNVDTLMRSASGLQFESGGGGQGVTYLSLVAKVPMGGGYVNEGLVVFLEHLTIGNTSVGASKAGSPPVDAYGAVTVDSFNDPLAIASVPSSLQTVMRDSDRLFVGETLYNPVELGFAAYVGIDAIHSRAYF